MRKPLRVALFATALVCALYAAVGTPLLAGAHTWDVNEVFVNGDGSIWFIELREIGGGVARGDLCEWESSDEPCAAKTRQKKRDASA